MVEMVNTAIIAVRSHLTTYVHIVISFHRLHTILIGFNEWCFLFFKPIECVSLAKVFDVSL